MWILYTVLAIVMRAVYGVLTKVLSNHIKVGPITQSVFLLLASGILSLAVVPFSGFSLAGVGDIWAIVLLTLTTSAVGNITYFKGIAKLESGTTQIAFSSILIWGLLMTNVFLGTTLSLLQSIGVVVLLFAILLAQYQKRAIKLQSGIFLILLSAASFAGFQVASARLAQEQTLGTYLVVIYVGSALLIALPYIPQIKRELAHARGHVTALAKIALITGSASMFNYVFAYFAFRTAPDPGIVVLLFTAQVVLAVILSIIFLKERSNVPLKIAAGVLAVVAAIMIKA